MITFISALFNEEKELEDLIQHVLPYVDNLIFVDDGSRDSTPELLKYWAQVNDKITYEVIEHTGLPEVVKHHALSKVIGDPWVILLDADERLPTGTLEKIVLFVNSEESKDITHVWFGLDEFIDGNYMRSFLKCRLFRASAIHFSDQVHIDDVFDGKGANLGWKIIHRKSSQKQVQREHEYLATYKKLLEEGKITEDRVAWMKSLHYFVKEDLVPHG